MRGDWSRREGYERGLYAFSTKFPSRLDEVGLDASDHAAIQWAVQRLVREAKPEDFRPMRQPYKNEPGYGFEFDSQCLRRRVYFKLRLIGRRPRVEICSLHRPDRLL